MWGLIVCGVDVRVWIGCIMGCEVMIGGPASWRETGKGICMMPWGMVTMGPAGFMMGICVAVDAMCMSRLFCWWERRGGGRERAMCQQGIEQPTPAAAHTRRHAKHFRWYAHVRVLRYCAILHHHVDHLAALNRTPTLHHPSFPVLTLKVSSSVGSPL